MKLLDKAIEASKPVRELSGSVKQLAQGLERVAQSVEKLAKNVAALAQHQAAHHRMIAHMHLVQQVILRRLSDGGVDTSLPDIDVLKDKAAAKKSN